MDGGERCGYFVRVALGIFGLTQWVTEWYEHRRY